MNENLLLHYKALSKFQELYYKDILTDNNLAGDEVNFKKLTLPDGGEIDNFWGYVFVKDGKKYLLKSHDANNDVIDLRGTLPIKPKSFLKVSHRSDVYYLIDKYSSVKYRKEQKLSFKECVSRLNSFSTTNKEQRKLLILTILAQYFGRSNFRISTNPGSGKDSIVDTLGMLFGKAHTVTSPTTPKLEGLANMSKLIVINEAADMNMPKWVELEQFLLDCGAFKPVVTKRSRKFENVDEFIDITQLSLALFYNDIDCYPHDTKYIDHISKEAVLDRFPAFRFYGVLNENFNEINTINVEELVSNNMDYYKDLIASLEYWVDKVDNYFLLMNYDVNIDKNVSPRWKINLSNLLKFVALYAEDKEEFESIKKEFYDSIDEYKYMIEYKNLCSNGTWLFKHHKLFKDRVFSLKQEDTQQVLNFENGLDKTKR